MKTIFSTLLATLFFILSHCSLANELKGISLDLQASLNQQLTINNERYGVVGQSVLILKNHQEIYSGQHGFANIELNVEITEKHIFPSYSITKLLTSVLVMQQVEQGNIDLKKSILTYLPYLPEQWQSVTVNHLLNHTSGIPRYFDSAMEKGVFLPTKKEVFLSLFNEPAHFEIGTKNSYNNTNFLLLSAILEAKTGKSYQALVAERIINPLGLKNTGHASAKEVINNHVTSYRGANGKIRKNMNIDWPDYTFSHSALYSTPKDLAAFITALVTEKFVSQKTLEQLLQPMNLADGSNGHYAFGFEYAFEDGYYHFGHDGGNHVKLRHYYNPKESEDNYTLVYATNGNAHGVWTDVLADSLMSIVDPESFEIATIKEQFLSNFFAKNDKGLIDSYKAISKFFDGNKALIERFLLYRSYAIWYGSGVENSIPAFKLLLSKFPNSDRAHRAIIDANALINK
jgi:CubicO group peptidase (beta-lactamase class C family)